jgi:hypothetical protein
LTSCADKLFHADRCVEGAILILCVHWPIWRGVKCNASTNRSRSGQVLRVLTVSVAPQDSRYESLINNARVRIYACKPMSPGYELDPGRTRASILC